MFLLDFLMIVWAYASNRWLYEIVRLESVFSFAVSNGDQFSTPITLNLDPEYLQRNAA